MTQGPGLDCSACGAALAPDQRYCVECGERRRLVPERRVPPPALAARPARAGLRRAWLGLPLGWMPAPGGWAPPTPRSLAAAVMGLVAAGVLLGSTLSPVAAGVASAPLLVARQSPPAPTPVPTPAATPRATPEPTPAVTAPQAPTAAPAAAPTVAAPTPSPSPEATPTPTPSALPPVKHVFLVVLTGHGHDEAFGAGSSAPYLSRSLAGRGEVVSNYYGVTQGALANEIALLSGQGPTPATAANCPVYADVVPGTVGADGQAAGDGCVYPVGVQTVVDQLTSAGQSWKAYLEQAAPAGQSACRHPVLGAPDDATAARPGDPYVTWRNPFVDFHSLLDSGACETNVVGLDRLAPDLRAQGTTPALSLIVPDACHDGSDAPCEPGAPAGLAPADAWLRTVVPAILASPAYKAGGLLAVTFDQAPATGPHADTSFCCGSPTFANLAPPAPNAAPAPPADPTPVGTPTPTPGATPTPTPGATGSPGGGRVGLLLVSPYVKPATTAVVSAYNHFSLLKSIEDLFGLQHLGYANDPALPAFDRAVYTNWPPAR